MELDIELSNVISRDYKALFEVNRCYENVYRLMTEDISAVPSHRITSTMFCYACNEDGIYYRHAFCLINDRIIEPLPHITHGLIVAGIIQIKNLTPSEYFTLAVKDERYDLFPSILQDEILAFNTHPILTTMLNPIDMGELVREVSPTITDYHRIMRDVQAGRGIIQST